MAKKPTMDTTEAMIVTELLDLLGLLNVCDPAPVPLKSPVVIVTVPFASVVDPVVTTVNPIVVLLVAVLASVVVVVVIFTRSVANTSINHKSFNMPVNHITTLYYAYLCYLHRLENRILRLQIYKN